MEFTWKGNHDIWKGVGIYHLTFAVKGRLRLLGELVPISECHFYNRDVQRLINNDGSTPDDSTQASNKYTCKNATVNLLPLGFACSASIEALKSEPEGIIVCAKQIMPDHIHVILWITKPGGRSIRQLGNGFRIGIKKKAIELGLWKAEDGHILEIPFIRTLSHKRQLRQMIDYVHANPDSAWDRKMTPDLYVIRRNCTYAGLQFDCMGKERLLSYPDRQVIALSRSLTAEQIKAQVHQALQKAERGTVTYTAAINNGEKSVSKAIREAGWPLVVMMLDGFPPEGTEAAKYFHPSGVYHEACGKGLLYLMAPSPANYDNPQLIALTDQELARKDAEKGHSYHGIPHDSKRWRMIAGNVMLKMIAESQE